MIAYHFLRVDFRTSQGDEEPWKVGETRTIAEPSRIVLCKYGYHYSRTLWEALPYAPGPLACQVEVPDDALYENDKGVAVSRTLISVVNIDLELRLFTCDCAEHVLHFFEHKYPQDQRPRTAIEVARRFVTAHATEKELNIARAAAWDAARDAEQDATWNAARVAAQAAAWNAELDTGWNATRTARASAQVAAWVAARNTEQVDAWDAESSWQQQHFNKMFSNIFVKEN